MDVGVAIGPSTEVAGVEYLWMEWVVVLHAWFVRIVEVVYPRGERVVDVVYSRWERVVVVYSWLV